MTFPNLLGRAPKHGLVRCNYVDAGTPCRAPATWHVAWHFRPPAEFSLVCNEHMAVVQQELVYVDRHPAAVNCDMPGTAWQTSTPSRCVPVTVEDLVTRAKTSLALHQGEGS
ncbi:hypothetical protein [Streptomyces sp. NPDC057413]|uniref:hypothetical protein n=1 Tax=Streptomyces sp. NPDC057413 TaxID=3346124 RepID=UPI0036978D52